MRFVVRTLCVWPLTAQRPVRRGHRAGNLAQVDVQAAPAPLPVGPGRDRPPGRARRGGSRSRGRRSRRCRRGLVGAPDRTGDLGPGSRGAPTGRGSPRRRDSVLSGVGRRRLWQSPGKTWGAETTRSSRLRRRSPTPGGCGDIWPGGRLRRRRFAGLSHPREADKTRSRVIWAGVRNTYSVSLVRRHEQ